ncbi:MAG: ribonuclease HII, partial [Candidatus Heimdallarchaeota archaeon]|nr:ribonuclease HII [Candidatus Heimdallarchaeota archaeon]
VISAEDINRFHYKKKLTLNQIEEQGFAQLLNDLQQKPQTVFLDACDTSEDRFEKTIGKMLSFTPNQIISKHKGDSIFKIVGAGSIIAKTHRDQIIEQYKQRYGDIGSGYPSDPTTKAYLNAYYKKNRKFPPIVRTWWKTCDNILKQYQNEHHQKKLTDF